MRGTRVRIHRQSALRMLVGALGRTEHCTSKVCLPRLRGVQLLDWKYTIW